MKDEATQILDELGISVSDAVGIFLKQVVIHKGFPFPIKLESNKKEESGDNS